MSFTSKHAPGTVYRRALRRVDRRSRVYVAAGIAESLAHDHPTWSHTMAFGPCTRPTGVGDLYALLIEAARLSNVLAVYAYGKPARAAQTRLMPAPSTTTRS